MQLNLLRLDFIQLNRNLIGFVLPISRWQTANTHTPHTDKKKPRQKTYDGHVVTKITATQPPCINTAKKQHKNIVLCL